MRDEGALRDLLRRIDGRGYKAYKDLRGSYRLPAATLDVEHVQGDPFAAPSRVQLRVDADAAAWPEWLTAERSRRIAFADWLARRAATAIAEVVRGGRGSGKSGRVFVDEGRQAVLERTAASADADGVTLRLEVGLPAAGRRVLGREAEGLLLDDLQQLADAVLYANERAADEAVHHVETVENHEALQAALAERGLVAFVADGALLPRESGASERPLGTGGMPFESPPGLRVALPLPHPVEGRATVSGMGIPEGVTLIVGGGYHGKSTVLHALGRAVHPHLPGDGRECVATLASAVKVRAEDGRRVAGCDIHGFIDTLPGGRDTHAFESDDASGSTSQAAAIVEAVEAGARLLLLDEDTSATNFMVRDARMQALVSRDHEPITPFVDRVRELYDRLGVSSLLVMGGSGDYFDVADTVIEMRDFRAHEVTAEARRVAAEIETRRRSEVRAPLAAWAPRVPVAASVDPSRGRRDEKIDVRDTGEIGFGSSRIDLRAVEQLVEPSQLRAIGHALAAARRFMGPGRALPEVLADLEAWLDEEGLRALTTRANLARPRPQEIAAALNRLRSLRVERQSTGGIDSARSRSSEV